MKEKALIGGQAVIEGVLMKNGSKVAIAVRRPDKKIVLKKETYNIASKYGFLKWPFIRGTNNLIEMLVLGLRALEFSAKEAMGEEEESSKAEFTITTAISLVIAVGLFIVLPLFLAKLTHTEGVLFNLIDGVFRLVIFIAYLLALSFMDDVKRLFQYHGAEHKTVNCYEAGKKLTVDNIKKHSTIHRRCGTTFILIVFIVSVIAFSFITSESFVVKLAARILLLPVIAGISYELLKLGAKYPKNILLMILIYPGLLLQRITTREPDKKQIEVALKAFNAVR